MDSKMLVEIGLTLSQAKSYLNLIESGELSPAELAKRCGENRTTTYMILDKLEQLGLVEKGGNKKITYKATNPLALEALILKQKKDIAETESKIRAFMPKLVSYYYTFTEKPGIMLVEGKEGLKEIYTDTLRTKKDITFLRSPVEVDYMGQDFYDKYRLKRAKLGIKVKAYTQSTDSITDAQKQKDDDKFNINRHWISRSDYGAPVEINVYGDKVALLVFGNEMMGVILQSPAIASALKQLIAKLDRV